jgi:hypothetical protein
MRAPIEKTYAPNMLFSSLEEVFNPDKLKIPTRVIPDSFIEATQLGKCEGYLFPTTGTYKIKTGTEILGLIGFGNEYTRKLSYGNIELIIEPYNWYSLRSDNKKAYCLIFNEKANTLEKRIDEHQNELFSDISLLLHMCPNQMIEMFNFSRKKLDIVSII